MTAIKTYHCLNEIRVAKGVAGHERVHQDFLLNGLFDFNGVAQIALLLVNFDLRAHGGPYF
jgi:hypothetical protein